MHSHKNTSSGDRAEKRLKIADNKSMVPPAGASNSYEKIRDKIDAADERAIRNKPYTKEKMMNK